METLKGIRAGITEVDRAILSLLSTRMRLVSLIARAKAEHGYPVFDPAREVEVLSMVREEAARRGLPPDLASEIYAAILRYSRCLQVTCPEKLRIAIYGYGNMARMLASHMMRAGCWVALTGRDMERARSVAESIGVEAMQEDEAIEWADMLLYTVPGSAVPQLLEKHATRLRESQLVADIASVKKPLIEAIKNTVEKHGFEYASLHPLFGPLDCPAGETIAIVPVRLDSWKERLERLLEGLGLRYEYVDADTHDRIMAANQVLHHAALEAFKRAYMLLLERLGVSQGRAKLLMTHSLRITLSLLDRLEKLQRVVLEIRRENPYSTEALRALRDIVEDLLEEMRASA